MTYHNCISLYLYFIFVFYLFLGIESFTPAGRSVHSSVLVGNKLYFFGGAINKDFCSNEFFYLDISQQFNIASPPWNDLTAKEGMPIKSCWGTASLSEANNEQSIYLFGGMTRDKITNGDSFKSLTYKLDLKSGQWEIPIINGKAPERRREMRAINDNSGKLYIFGGSADQTVGSSTDKLFNDMVIFNSVDSSWSISNLSNAPTQRAAYSATLLSNGVIVYIGGYHESAENIKQIDMSQINLYDTKSLTWSVQKANLIGQIDNRDAHTAVLATNGKIIVHGGCKNIGNLDYAQVTPNIVVLNTETNPFEWTIPLVVSNVGEVPSLVDHTANIVGNHMIVAFGNITQPNANPASTNANIYIMDIGNYTWVNTLKPENPTNSSTSTAGQTPLTNTSTTSTRPTITAETEVSSQITTMKVVIGTISGILGTAILMTAGIFGYKLYKRHQRVRQDGIMRIHGNTRQPVD